MTHYWISEVILSNEKLGTIDHYLPPYLPISYTYTKKVLYIPSAALGPRDSEENFDSL